LLDNILSAPYPVNMASRNTDVEIVHSTPDERVVIWTAGVEPWGQSMGGDVYVRREAHLSTIPTGRGGRMSYWVLTEKDVCTDVIDPPPPT
jgi:hypothetical protein